MPVPTGRRRSLGKERGGSCTPIIRGKLKEKKKEKGRTASPSEEERKKKEKPAAGKEGGPDASCLAARLPLKENNGGEKKKNGSSSCSEEHGKGGLSSPLCPARKGRKGKDGATRKKKKGENINFPASIREEGRGGGRSSCESSGGEGE